KQADLKGRFRSKDDRIHLSAFFELYLHALLLKAGFTVEVEPPARDKPTRPDYKVVKNGKPIFYLEATLVSWSDEEGSVRAREHQVYDILNKMNSPNFFIGIKVHSVSNVSPPAAKIRQFVKHKLDELDPDRIMEQYNKYGIEALPHWDWKRDGWHITVYPIPKKPKARGKSGVRPIGIQTCIRFITPHVRIREAIRDKATKYGRLDLPYIVAINIVDIFGADEDDIIRALFGEKQYTLTLCGNKKVAEIKLKPNGVWYGPNGPRNRRVSGVLIAVRLYPERIAKVTPVLWHNPWAYYQLSPNVWPLPQLAWDPTVKLAKYSGRDAWQLLGLHPNWPNIRS
ncbi:MAG: hypothetical protein DRG83_11805, partial [Deltaproteobacteria bacterium]